MEKCVTCQFFDRQNTRQGEGRGAQWGPCRRTAPRLSPINAKSYMIEGVWPHVRDDDWCGEWKIRPRRTESRDAELSTGAVVANLMTPSPAVARPMLVAAAQVTTIHPPAAKLPVADERASVMSIGAAD